MEEEEEYRKARAAVNRKGIDLEGYFMVGVSFGVQETCVLVPKLKCAFDIGRCPSRATHAHLDHIGYVVYSVRKKQYALISKITDTILSPECAFTGDSTAEYMLDPRNADALRAKLLITEATFLDEGFSIEHAQKHGHTHLSQTVCKNLYKDAFTCHGFRVERVLQFLDDAIRSLDDHPHFVVTFLMKRRGSIQAPMLDYAPVPLSMFSSPPRRSPLSAWFKRGAVLFSGENPSNQTSRMKLGY